MVYKLVPLTPEVGEGVFDMFQHIGPKENEFSNEAFGMSPDEYDAWLERQDAWSRGESLPDGYVRQWAYAFFVDEVPVGYGKIRECLTEESRKSGGNIGYAIDERFRGKGYGTELISRLVDEAEKLGVVEKLLTVKKQNYASRRAIEKIGAKLVSENQDWLYFKV